MASLSSVNPLIRRLDSSSSSTFVSITPDTPEKRNRWSRFPSDMQYQILLFLNKYDLASVECSARMQNTLSEWTWRYHRDHDYYRYEWRDCIRLVNGKNKANYLLSHYLELMIINPLGGLTQAEKKYVKYLGDIFPQFGYVVRKIFPDPTLPSGFTNRLQHIMKSCFTCCSSPSVPDPLREEILNESQSEIQYGGTLLLRQLLLLKEREGITITLNVQQGLQLVRLRVTHINLFNDKLKKEERESLAIAAAILEKDFRPLEQMLLTASFNPAEYHELIDKYSTNNDADLAPILYHLSLRLDEKNGEESERLLIKSLENYKDGPINRAPIEVYKRLGYIKFKLGQYQEAHALYDQVFQTTPHVIYGSEECPSKFLKEYIFIKMYLGAVLKAQDKLFEAQCFYNTAWKLYEPFNIERLLLDDLRNMDYLARHLRKYEEAKIISDKISKRLS